MKSDWINKPWGLYKILYQNKDIKIKIIRITPSRRTSLQYHKLRTELFYHLSGNIRFIIEERIILTTIFNNEAIKVKKKELHRIENMSHSDEAIILEIQKGICRENDIVRIDDDYGREKKT
jgi:mannose-1-phosphate guanylyltransferase